MFEKTDYCEIAAQLLRNLLSARVLLESAQATFDPANDRHALADRAPIAARQIIEHAINPTCSLPNDQLIEFEAYA